MSENEILARDFCFLLSCAQNILLLMLNTIEVTGKKDTRSGFGDGILEAAV